MTVTKFIDKGRRSQELANVQHNLNHQINKQQSESKAAAPHRRLSHKLKQDNLTVVTAWSSSMGLETNVAHR